MDRTSATKSAVLFAALAAVTPVCAQQTTETATSVTPAAGAERQGELPRQLSNKLRLLAGMVENSPAARRIDAAQHSGEAKALLTEARQAHTQAKEQLESGEFDAAERLLNAGLRALSSAARMVANVERKQHAEGERHQALRERAMSFRAAFARVVNEKGAAAAALFDQTRFNEQLAQAEVQAEQRRYREANAYLAQALATVEHALAKVRDQETLVQTLNFATPEDEYAYELERNRSHQMLVRLMLAERELAAASRTMIDAFLARNQTNRTRAITLAERGNTTAAIEALEAGTQELVRALRLTGLSF